MSSPPSLDFALDFTGVLSESKRIIYAHSRHFLALSVLFLLPLSFIITIYTTLSHLLTQSQTHPTQILLRNDLNQSISSQTLLVPIIYFIVILTFSLCAVGSITYSVFHGFYGRPVKLISAISSLFHSIVPLFLTLLVSQVIQFAICFAFGLVAFVVIKGIEFWGFRIEYSSPYFVGFFAVSLVFLALVLLCLQVNWALSPVIVVVESSWGLEPLRRSASLVMGMRGVALSLLLFFGISTGTLVWTTSIWKEGYHGSDSGWKSWAYVLQTVVTTTVVMVLMLHSFAANTVLYMYCKAMNGELAGEIAEEFATEYISLPFDDGKVPRVVSVIST